MKKLTILFLMIFITGILFSEDIVLTNKKLLHGEILKYSDNIIFLKSETTLYKITNDVILNITKDNEIIKVEPFSKIINYNKFYEVIEINKSNLNINTKNIEREVNKNVFDELVDSENYKVYLKNNDIIVGKMLKADYADCYLTSLNSPELFVISKSVIFRISVNNNEIDKENFVINLNKNIEYNHFDKTVQINDLTIAEHRYSNNIDFSEDKTFRRAKKTFIKVTFGPAMINNPFISNTGDLTKTRLGYDLVSIYHRLSLRKLVGFSINGGADRYAYQADYIQYSHYLYSIKYLEFLNSNKYYLEAGIGISKIVLSSSFGDPISSENGTGITLDIGKKFKYFCIELGMNYHMVESESFFITALKFGIFL